MIESALVSCEWLAQNLNDENQVILDATFFLPRQQRNGRAEYQQHIPGALFFEIDAVADLASPLPHTLPNAEEFSDAIGKMGIGNNIKVLIYDNNHFFAAARVWWMFRVFGHDQVRILDGGLERWKQLNFPVDSEQQFSTKKVFNARYRPELVFDLRQMLSTQQTNARQIIDARSADSFSGQRPLAAIDLQPGHIPGSINIPYANLTDGEQQTLISNNKLKTLFEENHVDLSQPIVTTCGSGVSAAVLALALYQLGLTEIPVYDGSWAEWGRQNDTPKQTNE
ncbi:MAG: 3-mercaptopyruvate sulfurtransferase [Methylococcales bacterium]|nr:3-mercaptopyruvate sulfurtransferase [Methylococcales bacterium]